MGPFYDSEKMQSNEPSVKMTNFPTNATNSDQIGGIKVNVKDYSIQFFHSNLPGIDGSEFHVHIVDGGEDVGGALDDAFASFGHRHRRAAGDQHRLVAAAQRQIRHEVPLH